MYGLQSPSSGNTKVYCQKSLRDRELGSFHTAGNSSATKGLCCREHIWDIILCQSNQCISYYEAISPLTFWGGYLNTSSLVLQSHHVVVRRIQKPSSFSLRKNPSHQTATHLETVYFYNREGAFQAIPFTHCGLRALWAPQASESFLDSAIAPFNSTLHGKQTMIGERVSCFRRKMDWAAAILGTS